MYNVVVADTSFTVDVKEEGFLVNDAAVSWDIQKISDRQYHILFNNKSFNAELINIDTALKVVTLSINGHRFPIKVKDRFDLLLEKMGISAASTGVVNTVKAPMPGLIIDLKVQPGDAVKVGDMLLVLEAMKMENTLKSPRDGIIKLIRVSKGDTVEKGQVLLEF